MRDIPPVNIAEATFPAVVPGAPDESATDLAPPDMDADIGAALETDSDIGSRGGGGGDPPSTPAAAAAKMIAHVP